MFGGLCRTIWCGVFGENGIREALRIVNGPFLSLSLFSLLLFSNGVWFYLLFLVLSMIFCLFGICWVMPQRVADLLDCWSCNFRQHRNIVVWRIVPHCLMWCIWRERNSRSFEDRERAILEFKSFFFSTLLEWCLVLPSFSCISLSRLLEHFTLFSWCFCLFSTFTMYWLCFFNLLLSYLYKKKKKKIKHCSWLSHYLQII